MVDDIPLVWLAAVFCPVLPMCIRIYYITLARIRVYLMR